LATDNRFLMKVENTLEYGWWAKTQTLLAVWPTTKFDINCVYVLEFPTLEPLFMSLLVFIVSIGVVLDIW
jgi:hypothetical protein